MINKIIGVKGFDKDLKCRGFQYQIGKSYKEEVKPNLCNTGFHYCSTIEDCFKYYPNKNGNRYCIVEAVGDIDTGLDKNCTNEIKIVKEITSNMNVSFVPEYIKSLCNKGFVIGGSEALRIHGFKIERKSREIDLIISSKDWENIKDESFVGYKEIKRYSGMNSVKCLIGILGEKYDIILQDNISTVKRNVEGCELNIQDSNSIWEYKLKYAMNGSIKHIDDIKNNNIEFMVKPISKSNTINNFYDTL